MILWYSVCHFERLANFGIGKGVHSACGVVQNEYFRLLQESTRNTKTLLLTSRNINAALAEVGVVAVGEAHYKVVSLSCLTGVYYLLLGGVFVAPAEVINNCARESTFSEAPYLRLHEAQKACIFDVFAADENLAAGHVVKSRNKAYERCLCASRTAYNAYGFAGIYLKLAPSITFFLPSELYLKLTFLNSTEPSLTLRSG